MTALYLCFPQFNLVLMEDDAVKDDATRALRRRAAKNAFVISFLYVGLGTLLLLSLRSSSGGELTYIGLLITLPVTIIGFGIMYAAREPYLMLFFVQMIMLLISWAVVYFFGTSGNQHENGFVLAL
jgi:hypothetical protein